MFAVNRIVRVIGRIIHLIDSIKIINGINTLGVPWGTKWVNIWEVRFNHPNNIILNHKGSVNDRLIDKCLVLVKIYGNNPKKLFNIINMKIEINIKLKLLFSFLIIILNSLNKLFNVLKYNKLKLFKVIQYILGIINKINNIIDQFIGI